MFSRQRTVGQFPMSLNPTGWCWWRTALLLFLFLSVPSTGRAKTKKGNDSDITNIVRPDLVNAETDPTLRFPIMSAGGSVFSITYGWLDISNSTIRYTVVQPTSKSGHSFEVSRLAIGDLRLQRGMAHVQGPQEGGDAYLSTSRSLGISPHGSRYGRGSQPRKFGDVINLQDVVEFRRRDGAGEASRPSARTCYRATRGARTDAQARCAPFSARDCAVVPSRRRGEPDPGIGGIHGGHSRRGHG